MAAHTLQVTNFFIEDSGAIEIACLLDGDIPCGRRFAGGLDDVRLFSDPLAAEALEAIMGRLLFAWWLSRDGDLSNPNLVLGKTLTVDYSQVIALQMSVV